jgi:hypothetical protein
MKIACCFSLSDLHQKVYLFKDEGLIKCVALGDVNNLDEVIVTMCNKYNCNTVHLFGNETYLEKLTEDIKICFAKKYERNNIEILIN